VTLTPAAFLRAGLIALTAIVLEISGIGTMRLFGASPDLVPLAVAGVAIYAGSVSGAAMGFGTGLLLDLAIGGTMGVSSLVLTAVGYAVGRYREVRDPAHGLMPIPVGAAATLGWGATFAAVSFMLDVGASVSPVIFREMLVTSAIGALLAIPVFWLCRKILRPSLVIDPFELRRRRGRARETGPLGLRGLEI
jgi:rod shape-determining protein MreD